MLPPAEDRLGSIIQVPKEGPRSKPAYWAGQPRRANQLYNVPKEAVRIDSTNFGICQGFCWKKHKGKDGVVVVAGKAEDGAASRIR